MTYKAYVIAASLALSPLVFAADDVAKTAADKTIITVNSEAITQADYDAYASARNRQSKTPVDKKVIAEELIARELLYQQALKSDVEKDPVYQARLQTMRYNLLTEGMMRKYLADNPVSDEQVRKLYEELPNKAEWPTEYSASHILLEDEASAKAVLEELKAGKEFAALAKEKSGDQGSAEKGGSLGWFGLRDMVKPFAAALETLEKGKYSDAPVKSKFGWHVILLEDTRPLQLPEFDSVKERLRQSLQNDLMGEWSKELRAKAKIDMQLGDDTPAAGK